VKINALPAALVFRGGRIWVSFNQAFSSDKMESFGRKDIEVVQEENQWKMAEEIFKVREYKEKGPGLPLEGSVDSDPKMGQRRYLDAPYVIHASSHLDYTAATKASNLLRKRGLEAYTSPVELPGGKSIYRIYIGRFADWELTQEIALEVRKIDAGRDAIPVHLPYTVQLGIYDAETEAVERVQKLRTQGFSAFVYTSSEHNFSHPEFRVFLGAFDSRQNAEQVSLKLSALNIVSSPKTP